jgi:Transposase zinc-binding domain
MDRPRLCASDLNCGMFAHGFARARCDDCGYDNFVVFSCKGRGVRSSCSTRRMVVTKAHLTDHIIPSMPVRHAATGLP